jgi:hypothetical protein
MIRTGWLLLLAGLAGLPGCRQEEPARPQQKSQPVNAFSMYLNGRYWEPSGIGADPCQRTFNGAWSAITTADDQRIPYYTVVAYRDRRSLTSAESENALRIQIMDVQKVGRYPISGAYQGDFTSHAVLNINAPDGTRKRYVNRAGSDAFVVEVTELFAPLTELPVNGIQGTFYGTLYNEADALDSLTISRGAFTLKKVNWYNFDQCAP